jgi:hypothetical protein
MDDGKSLRGRVGAWSALLSSVTALVFSVYSLYETVIKQADLRIYQPPLMRCWETLGTAVIEEVAHATADSYYLDPHGTQSGNRTACGALPGTRLPLV